MIFERMSANIFHKVRQLESLSKTSLFSNSCKAPQLSRTSTNFAGINQCLNSTVTKYGNTRFMEKLPTITTVALQQNRKAATASGDHVRLWVFEKIVSAALPAVIPAALLMENAVLDGLMSVLVVMHTHWGLEAIITDYARPSVVGSLLPKILHISLILLSAATLAGLLLLIHNGPGVARAVKDAWAIGKEPSTPPQTEKPVAT